MSALAVVMLLLSGVASLRPKRRKNFARLLTAPAPLPRFCRGSTFLKSRRWLVLESTIDISLSSGYRRGVAMRCELESLDRSERVPALPSHKPTNYPSASGYLTLGIPAKPLKSFVPGHKH